MNARLLPLALLAVGAACSVQLLDPLGRACDDAHPCSVGRTCLGGVCVRRDDASPELGEDGGGGEDVVLAGACADGDSCTVGVGSCARTGTLSCKPDGGARCSVRSGTPVPEVCDGQDNDCDGRPDISAEIELLPSSGGTFSELAWVGSGDGYLAVYTADRGSGRRAYLQRFDARLAAAGPEVALSLEANAPSFSPAIARAGEGALLSWAEVPVGAPARLLVGQLDDAGASGVTRRFVFPEQPVALRPRVFSANDQGYLFAVWADPQGQLLGLSLTAAGELFQAPTVLVSNTSSEGAARRVLDFSANPVGNNDVTLGAVISENNGPARLRFARFSERLVPKPGIREHAPAGGVFRVGSAPVKSPVGGVTEITAAAFTTLSPASVSSVVDATESSSQRVASSSNAGSWSLDVIQAPLGTVVAWIQAEDGRIFVRGPTSNVNLDLTWASALHGAFSAGAPPHLAAGPLNQMAIGYERAKPGQGTRLYGQVFCLP